MASKLHRSITTTENHSIHSWEAPNANQRKNMVLVATDIGRVCRQLDDGSMWVVTNWSPSEWRQVDSGSPIVTDYVRYVSTTGNDLNDGLTTGSAWTSLDKAVDNAPAMWTGKCRIYVAAGTYTYTKRALVSGIPIGRLAEPFVIVGEMVDSGVGTVTCAAGSTTTVFNTSTTLVNDAHYGARIRFLTGANTGLTMGIVSNSTSAISVLVSTNTQQVHPVAPALGDTFVIERPGTVIRIGSSNVSFLIMSNGTTPRLVGAGNISMGFYGIKWILGGLTWMLVNGAKTSLCFDSNEVVLGTLASNSKICVEFGAGINTRNLAFLSGYNDGDAALPFIGNSTMSSIFIQGAFPTGPSCALYTQHLGRLEYFTSLITDKASVHLCYQEGVSGAWNIRAGSIYLTEAAILVPYDNIVIDGQGLTTVGISVEPNCRLMSPYPISISNVNGDAISLRGSLETLSTLTGTGNSGYGIRLGAGAIAKVASSTIAGTAGDIIVGDTVTTHATLTSVGFVTNANHLARISRT